MKAVALLALTLVLGVSAAAATPTGPTSFRLRTIATIRAEVSSFAQNERYLAWIAVSKKSQCDALFIQDLRTHRRTAIRHRCGLGAGTPGALVLAGDRAFWESEAGSNLTEYTELLTASLRKRQVKTVDYQSIYNGGLEHIVEPVSDGRGVYFWSSPEDATPGPIYRYDRRAAWRKLTRTIRSLAALGAGEGRWAFAQAFRTLDCAQEPAWSPDGGLIAYASGGARNCRGGIWALNAGGHGERRVAAAGRNPDWSPDGSRLAYDQAGAIVVSDAAGARSVIPHGADPAWSPDGSRLAFVRDGSILVASIDGTGERAVVAAAIEPDWSPDGTQLVFARRDKGDPGLGVAGVDGGGVRSLTSGDDRHPAWSPDGRRIAYAHCTNDHVACPGDVSQILEIAPDGTGKRERTHDSDETFDTTPAWAPDSQRLVFARAREWQDDGDSHIFSLRGRLTATPPPGTPIVVRTPSGRTLARLPSTGAFELAVTRQVTAALVRAGTWRLEVLSRPRSKVTFLEASAVASLSAAGHRIVVLVGRRTIMLYNARTRRLDVVARAAASPIGLSIVGRRIAWAENLGRRARIRAVTLPP